MTKISQEISPIFFLPIMVHCSLIQGSQNGTTANNETGYTWEAKKFNKSGDGLNMK